MNDEEGFGRSIRDNPDDKGRRHGYADWLEERGDIIQMGTVQLMVVCCTSTGLIIP
jgi:uncharacterized protein (TIGR02996 family)